MTPKLRYVRMDRDDLAWERSDHEIEEWQRSLHKPETYHAIADLILIYRSGEAMELHTPIRGGYNVIFQLEFKDGTSAALRIPCKVSVKFPEEKVKYEVATMRYVAANTTIPVPRIYHHGTAAENTTGLGPFIIMDYINHERTMSHALNDPLQDDSDPHVLNKDIDHQKLEFLYRQMASILLQLSTLSFPQIGSLVQGEDGKTCASGRPLIQNMNSLVEFASVSPSLLPSKPFHTSTDWYSAMADMHLLQAMYQRNDAILDEEDAHDIYVARQLFRRAASSGRCATGNGEQDEGDGDFRLYSEDLRPSNVLIDENLRVVGVIDWEFAYAAPAQFTFDPPWWLLLKRPDDWDDGYVSWMEAYEPRLDTFLRVLAEEEDKMRHDAGCDIQATRSDGETRISPPLSQRMRTRWEDQSWLINYTARDSWAFDFVYWRYLDRRWYGPNEEADHHARLDLLSGSEKAAMDKFVRLKMEESKTRALVSVEERDGARAKGKMVEMMV